MCNSERPENKTELWTFLDLQFFKDISYHDITKTLVNLLNKSTTTKMRLLQIMVN